MSGKLLPIDRRRAADFVLELFAKLNNCGHGDRSGQVAAVIRIFANMLETVTERLNQAPQKNFMAFLNMIGISLLPPRPARVPLVFTAVEDSNGPVWVPAGTQVSAFTTPDQEEVVFETETNITVIGPQLIRAVSVDYGQDRWSDRSRLCGSGNPEGAVSFFSGTEPLPHRLYVGDSRLWSLTGTTVQVSWEKRSPLSSSDTQWYWLDGPVYHKVDTQSFAEGQREGIRFTMEKVPVSSLQGYDSDSQAHSWQNRWIAAVMSQADAELEWKSVMFSLDEQGTDLQLERAFFNEQPLDLSKPFLPFGERPKINDTFYLASAVFARAGTVVTVNLSAGLQKPTEKSELIWEYWSGEAWKLLGNSKIFTGGEKSESFTLPDLRPAVVNGITAYWLRIRLAKGDYGQEASYTLDKGGYQPATFNPPVIQNWLMNYKYSVAKQTPEMVLTEDNFCWRNVTKSCKAGKGFSIHRPAANDPTFYLGFDQSLSTLPVTLFFPVYQAETGLGGKAVWEYWNGSRWLSFAVEDGTLHFTRPGIVRFQIFATMVPRALFDSVQVWLRVRLENAKREALPRVQGVYVNTVWARQQQTVTAEIAGSSNGRPEQVVQLHHYPVLAGENVLVREESFGGAGSWGIESHPVHTNNTKEQATGESVRWQEVGSFALSGPDSRHYLLDRAHGTITFGDGRRGMIPPTGTDNIRCDYQYGGGLKGNVKAGSITELRTAVPGIAAVTNPVAAEGGAELEALENAKVRGPHLLQHRGRAVTRADFEWLAREASSAIGKVKCLPTTRRVPSMGADAPAEYRLEPGWVTLVVVPQSEEPQPTPSPELTEQIRDYLAKRTFMGLAGEIPRLAVIGPDYVRIDVMAKVRQEPAAETRKVEEKVRKSLQQFFHPLYGGPEGRGWEAARNVYSTELYGFIQDLAGVDLVEELKLAASRQCFTLRLDNAWVVSGNLPRGSLVETEDGRVCGLLAEELTAGTIRWTIPAKGFQEEQEVDLSHNETKLRLRIEAVQEGVLECRIAEGVWPPQGFPADSRLATSDKLLRSYLSAPARREGGRIILETAWFRDNSRVVLRRRKELHSAVVNVTAITADIVFLAPSELPYSGRLQVICHSTG